MAESDPEEAPRITEPDTITARFATTTRLEITEYFVRIVALDDHYVVGYDGPERRIVARLVLPVDTARELLRELRKGLQKGSH